MRFQFYTVTAVYPQDPAFTKTPCPVIETGISNSYQERRQKVTDAFVEHIAKYPGITNVIIMHEPTPEHPAGFVIAAEVTAPTTQRSLVFAITDSGT